MVCRCGLEGCGLGCNLGDEGGEEAGELSFYALACLHDLFVVDGVGGFASVGGDAGGHVGDEGEAEDFDAHVAGDDDLVNGGHADEIGSEGAEGADLGGGFEARPEDGEIDAFGEEKLLAGGLFDGEGAEAEGVGGGHVEEALGWGSKDGEAGLVGAEGCVGSGEVDVVGDCDDGALRKGGADAAGGVGDDEGFATEETEDAGGEGDLLHAVALVGVDAALHDGYGDAGDLAEDEVAGVALDGGLREVGDVGVGDAGGGFDVGGEAAETGAEDDAESWLEWGLAADVVGGGLRFAVEVDRLVGLGHSRS